MPSNLLTGYAKTRTAPSKGHTPRGYYDDDDMSEMSEISSEISGISQVIGQMQQLSSNRECHSIVMQPKVGGKKKIPQEVAQLALDSFEPDPRDIGYSVNTWAYKSNPRYKNALSNVVARSSQLAKHDKSAEIVEKLTYLLAEFKKTSEKSDLVTYIMMVSIAPIDDLLEYFARGEVIVEDKNGKIKSISVKSFISGKKKVGYWDKKVTDEVFKYDRKIHEDLPVTPKGCDSTVLANTMVTLMTPVLKYWQDTLRETLIELSKTKVLDDADSSDV